MTDSIKRKKHQPMVLPSPGIREHLAIQERALSYTSATGSYCSWSTEVNLGPPASSAKDIPAEDSHIRQYYEALQYTLYETGYPETVDRTANPRKGYTTRDPAIVILSSPVECMCFLLEGGRQCPGDMILVMSTTWLSKVPSDSRSGHDDSQVLYVHKGITSDRGGNTFIDCFDPPRRVTYFMDFFTNACTSRQRCDGEEVERHLECPMSSSVTLSALVDDKLLTRILAGQAGVPYPKTLAFPFKSSLTYDSALSGITVFPLSTTAGVVNIISAAITKFLKSEETEIYTKIDWRIQQLIHSVSPELFLSSVTQCILARPFYRKNDAMRSIKTKLVPRLNLIQQNSRQFCGMRVMIRVSNSRKHDFSQFLIVLMFTLFCF